MIDALRIVNYYPRDTPWKLMWTQWDQAVLAQDFERIASLGANTVRIIVHATDDTFGSPPNVSNDAVDMLERTVALADESGLRVQLTLFDLWGAYGEAGALDDSKRWASAVLAPFRCDRRIAFVELQNEIRPDDQAAMTWARALLPDVQNRAGLPVTISVTRRSDSLPLLSVALGALIDGLGATQPDFYTLHYLDSEPALAFADLADAKVLTDRPVLIGETGFSTVPPPAPPPEDPNGNPLARTAEVYEAFQEFYFRSMNFASRSLGLPPPAPWTLSDFKDGTILPGAPATEYGFGLFRIDGTAKPAAAVETALFTDGSVDASFNADFERAVDGGASRTLPAIWRMWHEPQATFARDTVVFHGGTASARISMSGGDATGVPAFYAAPIAIVRPDEVHMATVWARTENAPGETRICMAYYNVRNRWLAQDKCSDSISGTNAWTELRAEGVAPPGTAYVLIHLKSRDNPGSVWFDDVSFN